MHAPLFGLQGTPASSAAIDVILDLVSRFASELAEPDALKAQLVASLPHLRKRGMQCLGEGPMI